MNKTSIEWCDYTVNPIRFLPYGATRTTTMCQKLSPGCANCYASTIVNRFWPLEANEKFPGYTAQGIASGKFVLDEKQLLSVLKYKKPCKVFWGDMTDIFGEWVPSTMIDKCMAVCALTPHITHMFLTKRPEIMLKYFSDDQIETRVWNCAVRIDCEQHLSNKSLGYEVLLDPLHMAFPLNNVWVGTSCENQKYADERLDILRQVPASVRFVSAEPLIGSIDFSRFLHYNPIYEEQTQRGVCLPSGSGRGFGNNARRDDLEDTQERMGSLEEVCGEPSMQESSSRETNGEGGIVFSGDVDERRGTVLRSFSSSSLPPLQRSNTGRSYDQSRGWKEIEQPPGQPGTSNSFRTDYPCVQVGAEIRMGPDESSSETSRQRNLFDSGGVCSWWNNPRGDREEIRSGISNDLQDSSRGATDETIRQDSRLCEAQRSTRPTEGREGEILLIIVGGESGKNARPMNPQWARDIRDQCAGSTTSFFMKQMGSVYGEHKGKDLPPDLNIREFPEVKA